MSHWTSSNICIIFMDLFTINIHCGTVNLLLININTEAWAIGPIYLKFNYKC